jgi:hypothetical protein
MAGASGPNEGSVPSPPSGGASPIGSAPPQAHPSSQSRRANWAPSRRPRASPDPTSTAQGGVVPAGDTVPASVGAVGESWYGEGSALGNPQWRGLRGGPHPGARGLTRSGEDGASGEPGGGPRGLEVCTGDAERTHDGSRDDVALGDGDGPSVGSANSAPGVHGGPSGPDLQAAGPPNDVAEGASGLGGPTFPGPSGGPSHPLRLLPPASDLLLDTGTRPEDKHTTPRSGSGARAVLGRLFRWGGRVWDRGTSGGAPATGSVGASGPGGAGSPGSEPLGRGPGAGAALEPFLGTGTQLDALDTRYCHLARYRLGGVRLTQAPQ